jgi:hypothetical protein
MALCDQLINKQTWCWLLFNHIQYVQGSVEGRDQSGSLAMWLLLFFLSNQLVIYIPCMDLQVAHSTDR